MLSREMMGLLALGILWVNTLLIAAAAGIDLAALVTRWRSLRNRSVPTALGEGVFEGHIVRGNGPDGTFACQRIVQIGRSTGSGSSNRGIHFGDQTFDGEIFGGTIDVEIEPGRVEEVLVAPAHPAEVWVSEKARAAACVQAAKTSFDAAFEDAKKARGFTRTVVTSVNASASERVWIVGSLRREQGDGRLTIDPSNVNAPLISTLNPKAVLMRRIALSLFAITAIVTVSAALSGVALYPPRFGLISTIGGALCLGYFLLVQPAGTALRDAIRLPHKAFLRGTWRPNP